MAAMKTLRLLAVVACLLSGESARGTISTGFESLTPGTQYALGSYIHADDLNFLVAPQSNTAIRVGSFGFAGGGGAVLAFTSRGSLQFILPAGVHEISFRFRSGNSDNRFHINGADSPQPTSFTQANGLVVGGVAISVVVESTNPYRAFTTLTGPIQSFRMTATELFMDDVTIDAAPTSGDFDEDGDVDGADYLRWQGGVGLTAGATRAHGDGDVDFDVDGADLAVWRGKFGKSLSAATTVPEPSALALAAIAAVALLIRQPRHRPE
jgi:hypothetical protein